MLNTMRSPGVRRPAAAAIVVAALGLGAGLARGDERSSEDRNDAPGRMDIRDASSGHAPDGRLRHVITTFGRWTGADLVSKSGPPGGVCLLVWTKRRPSAGSPDYLVCANADAKGEKLRGLVTRVSRRAGRTGRSTAAAVSRPDNRSLVLRFARSQIGKPDRYYWRAETVYHATNCPKGTGCLDTAPDRPGARSHILERAEESPEDPTPR